MTTIKVPTGLRDRISAASKAQGVPANEFLSELMNNYERELRATAVRDAYQRLSPKQRAEYAAEATVWDETVGDGLASW